MLRNYINYLSALCTFLLLVACGGGAGPGGASGDCLLLATCSASATLPATPLSRPANFNARQLAKSASSYAIYYGALDAATIQTLQTYPLVIVHPYDGNITRSQIQALQVGSSAAGTSQSVVVLCYISIGEDSRTFGLSNAQLLADPRFVGDGTGPSVDPRGTGVSTRALTGVNPIGTPTNSGFASWYMNDNATYNTSAPVNVPDENPNFLTRYVNAGDPKWYDVINNELTDAAVPVGYQRNPPGLKEMLSTNYGRGLGCDGVFLDTMDTAAPNYFASTVSNFEWTAQGFTNFIAKLRTDYPDSVILQNRGVFFFDPRQPQYDVSARGNIDLLLFESYRMDSDSSNIYNSNYFPDNKFNYAPKIMAEANRSDGFSVVSLDYGNGSAGNKPGIDIDTLVGTATAGFSEFITDIQESLSVGFKPYITDAQVQLVNNFVKINAPLATALPLRWSSTYNANPGSATTVASAPAPRVGVQAVTVAGTSVTLSWDVALAVTRVGYTLYYQTTPFNFSADPHLSAATHIALTPTAGAGYSQAWNNATPDAALQSVYPYEQTISNLATGNTYYFVVRAHDSAGNEEQNQTVLSATL